MIDTAYVLAFVFVLFRLTSYFMAVPIFFPNGTPQIAKIGFSSIFSYMLLTSVNYSNLGSLDNYFLIAFYCICEVLTGLILAYFTNLCFRFASMAGELIDVHVGFAMSRMFDPALGEASTTLGRLTYWICVITFFVIDGHHVLIRGLAYSFDVVPLGTLVLSPATAMQALDAFVKFFAIGIQISIPITLIILMTNLVLGLVAKSVPQLNVMILGMPIKILIGLVSFTLALPMILKIMLSEFDQIPHMFENVFKTIPFILVFADSGGEKTEEATPKKKRDAKKKGQVAKSKELGSAFSLIAVTVILLSFGDYIGRSIRDIILLFFNNYLNSNLDYNTLNGITLISLINIGKIFLLFAVPIMLIGVAVNFAQSGYILTGETLKPDFKKLNPISGAKKIFSVRSVVQLVKSLLIVSVIGYVGYKFFIDKYSTILNLGNLRFSAIPHYLNKLTIDLFFRIALITLIIAIADYVFQKYQHKKDLRMSKQEIKEEFKQMEGDPQIKSKIKQKQREMAMSRMMQSVPDATVVVTNPTHIAVALRYKDGKDEAPKVIAKGADYVAIKIKEMAKENEVPIIENKPLARLIFSDVEIEQEIPADMYQAVAEILALVYKLKKKI